MVWGQSYAYNKGAPTLLISNVLSPSAENTELQLPYQQFAMQHTCAPLHPSDIEAKSVASESPTSFKNGIPGTHSARLL